MSLIISAPLRVRRNPVYCGKSSLEKLQKNRFKITVEKNITAHVSPTLAYLHMWGDQIGRPVLDFAVGKLERKRPGLHYWLEEVIEYGRESLLKQLRIVDPEIFIRSKKYMLLVIENS